MMAAPRFLIGSLAAVAAGLGLLLLPWLLPSWEWDRTMTKQRSVMANLHTVQIAVEQYAGDHDGRYPSRLAAPDFGWSRYVTDPLRNPYDSSEVGQRLIERNTEVDPPVAARAASAPPFQAAGHIAYYVSRDRTTYALTGAGRGGKPVEEIRNYKRYVYVLHNEAESPASIATGWAEPLYWASMFLSSGYSGLAIGAIIGIISGARRAVVSASLYVGLLLVLLGLACGLSNAVTGGWVLYSGYRALQGDPVVAAGLVCGALIGFASGDLLGRKTGWTAASFILGYAAGNIFLAVPSLR